MKKVAVLVDGFNLYYAIKNLQNALERSRSGSSYNYLKWVDLFKLSSLFVKKNERLADVYYFTAYAHWLEDDENTNPVIRHKTYTQFLAAMNVKVVLGKFKQTTRKCHACHQKYTTYEEKETDVNLSITAMELLCQGKIDKIIIVSADSDLVPPAEKWRVKNQEISFLIPPTYKRVTQEIQHKFPYQKIKEKHLESSLLTKSVKYQSKIIHRPDAYSPPQKPQ